jgi:hypothetical protein
MGPRLHDDAVLEDGDDVDVDDGGQAVRDDDGGPAVPGERRAF